MTVLAPYGTATSLAFRNLRTMNDTPVSDVANAYIPNSWQLDNERGSGPTRMLLCNSVLRHSWHRRARDAIGVTKRFLTFAHLYVFSPHTQSPALTSRQAQIQRTYDTCPRSAHQY